MLINLIPFVVRYLFLAMSSYYFLVEMFFWENLIFCLIFSDLMWGVCFSNKKIETGLMI